MNKPGAGFGLIVAIMLLGSLTLRSQVTIPDILEKGTLKEQMNYLEEKTRIYENYRAIREDMFQLVKNNAVDSLLKAENKIVEFSGLNSSLIIRIDSLNNILVTTKEQLKEAVRTKNNIRVIGIGVNKVAYNSIMFIIIGSLVFLLVVGFLAFKRNIVITQSTKKEFNELKTEFDAYRNKTRLDREKMSMDHFKEIQKLQGR
jgi:hypothetical protein